MTFCLGSLVVVAGRARGQPGGHGPGAGLLGHAVVADDGVEPAPGVGILCRVVGVQRGGDAALVLINKSIWATVVISEGFVHHKEHYAGKECKSQAYEDGDL